MVAELARVGTVTAATEQSVAWSATLGSVAEEIVWLGEPAAEARALVGGKVAPLSRLAAQYRVPLGFCLTTLAHDAALAWTTLHDADTDAVPGLPPVLRQQIAAACARLADLTGWISRPLPCTRRRWTRTALVPRSPASTTPS